VREYDFRGRHTGITHEQYLEEEADFVDWAILIAAVDREAVANVRQREKDRAERIERIMGKQP
jgi:hypothetical protein